ncbi:MAG: prolipoprotein diacylglyceryl transferase [Clostridia bacterium]
MGFEIFGYTIKMYGITISLAMLCAVAFACLNAKLRGLKSDDIILVALYALPLAIVGARIYYVIFSGHAYTFLEALQIWKGGMAIYGGVIGGALGVGLWTIIHKKNFLAIADVCAVSLILGQAIGRWGNFFNQEAYGTVVTNPSLQWFPFSVFIEKSATWHLATFFYESIWNLIVFAVLMILIRKINVKGIICGLYFILYGIGRMFIESLRTDSLMLGDFRVSQLVSFALIILGTVLIVVVNQKNIKLNRKKIENISNRKIK